VGRARPARSRFGGELAGEVNRISTDANEKGLCHGLEGGRGGCCVAEGGGIIGAIAGPAALALKQVAASSSMITYLASLIGR